jgi:hypothetical protein
MFAHLLSSATPCICLLICFTLGKVQDIANLSVELYPHLTHCLQGFCDWCLGLEKPFAVCIISLLEDGYGFVPHVALM